MLEEREWLGTWSIFSDDPERVFQGLLTYSPKNGGELKIGKQNAYWDEFQLLDQTQLIPVIKGYDYHSGKKITLIDCIIETHSVSSGVKIRIHPNIIIENLEYENLESLQFLTASVVYSGLSPWLGITGITKELLDDGQSFTGITMEYKQPESLKFDIGSLFKLQIDFGYSPGSDPRNFTGYELKETCYTSFIFEEPGMNFKDLLKWIEHYRRLFTTLFGQSSFITYFRVTDSLGLTLNNSYNVFYRNTIDSFPNRAPSLTRMRTQFKDIAIPLTDILHRWSIYHLSDDLDYVGWVASKNFQYFSEETFLEVSRSLEVFCGAIMNRNVYSEEIKEKFKLAIINKISTGEIFENATKNELSDDDKDSFDDMIEKLLSAVTYSDSISLRRKIKNALSLIKKQIDEEKFKKLFSDAKSLPDVIVDNRNYYTHYDENSIKRIKKNELNIEQLVLLTRKVKKIFLLLLFKDLGIPMQQIANSLIHLDVS